MKVIVYGFGVMGKKVVQAVRDNKNMELIGVVSPTFDQRIKETMYYSLSECYKRADIVIDFSHPSNLNDITNYALHYHCALVLATTGYTYEQLLHIQETSKTIPIFQSYNTSYGIAILTKVIKEICVDLYQHGYDIEIIEKHHRKKKDAPSGTALSLYQTIHQEIEETLPSYYRNHQRNKGEIGIQSIRAGTILGEHTVLFAGNDEILEFKHTVLSKDVFVLGAMQACYEIMEKDQGLYDLSDLYRESPYVKEK